MPLLDIGTLSMVLSETQVPKVKMSDQWYPGVYEEKCVQQV